MKIREWLNSEIDNLYIQLFILILMTLIIVMGCFLVMPIIFDLQIKLFDMFRPHDYCGCSNMLKNFTVILS